VYDADVGVLAASVDFELHRHVQVVTVVVVAEEGGPCRDGAMIVLIRERSYGCYGYNDHIISSLADAG
jgi:hypothetical protein